MTESSQGNKMPTVDVSKDFTKFNSADQHFIKRLELLNVDRAKDVKFFRGRNKLSGLLLGASALGIYFYTIYAVKQEKFLDFDAPAVVNK